MTKSGTLIVEAANPYDFNEGELDALAEELGGELDGVEVSVHRRTEEGYGGPLPEIIQIWQAAGGWAEDAVALGVVVKCAGGFLRERWLADRDSCGPDECPRGRAVTIFDANGKPLKSVQIDLPDGELVESKDVQQAARPMPGEN